ncbi:hypothetical protein [Bilophila wadsworthia]|jgi:hypothetical protein|uniref:hypothetical protein n=1 Tax=Bilophila wadsworthia TaxID=35833 RepID=UPI0027B8BB6D|nr:hypothetical protein [Bilophila wadsworthia]MDR4026398.1 hypothetical protein [Bilophila sp.]
MDASIRPYFCGELPCENKSLSGPREPGHCFFCNGFFSTAVHGYLARRRVYQPENPQLYAFGLVDALGAKKSDNHLVYFLFRSLHNAACATYGKSYARLHALMTYWIGLAPSFSWDTIDTMRPCRQCCGRREPEGRCGSSCVIAASYLQNIFREGGAESLELAKRILDVFLEMPGYARKKSYTVCDKIMQTDPRSCVGAGQYNRKVCHGIEISLMSRFEAWRVEHEKRAENYDPSEELPF